MSTTKYAFNVFTGNFDLVTDTISPSDITGGTPNTFAGFDSTGTLETIPRYTFNPDALHDFGMQFANTIDLAPDAGSANYFDVTSVHTDITPSITTVNQNPNIFSVTTNIDPTNIGNNINHVSVIDSFNTMSGSGTINEYFGMNLVLSIPNSGVITNYSGARVQFTAAAGSSIIDGSGIVVGMEADSSSSIGDGLVGIQVFGEMAAPIGTGGYEGVIVGPNLSNAMNFMSSFNSEVTFENGFASSGSVSIFNDQNEFQSGSSTQNYSSLELTPNFQVGSALNGYTGLYSGPQIDGIITTPSFRGIELGANIGPTTITHINDHIDIQTHPTYQANSTLDSYQGLSLGPTFTEGSGVHNAVGINLFMDMRGGITGNVGGYNANIDLGNGTAPVALNNFNEANYNTNFGANLTLTGYNGISVRANVQTGASITGDVILGDFAINNTIPVGGNATGVRIDMQNFQTAAMPQALNVNNGGTQLNANFDTGVYPTQSTGGPYGLNNIGGSFHVAAGHPITGGLFGIGNNLGIGVEIEDDVPVDTFGIRLGFIMNGFLTEIGAATGKTMDSLTFMGAGASNALLSSGTFDEINMFRVVGVLPGAGAIINNIYGYKVDPYLSAASPGNAWGVWVGDTNADNWFAKNVVIGGSTGHATSGAALDVTGDVGFRNFTAAGVVLNDAAGTLSTLPPGTSGNVLTSTGTAWVSAPAPGTAPTAPTAQVFNTGSGTYTRPTSPAPLYIKIKMIGGGGGGSGSGLAGSGTAGGTGGSSTFDTLTAGGGVGGTPNMGAGGAGGASTGGYLNMSGQVGGSFQFINILDASPPSISGGPGGNSAFFSGAGIFSSPVSGVGQDAQANSGGGGSGALANLAGVFAGTGGGGGGGLEAFISSPAATYAYSVGAGGGAGTGGSSGFTGGAGGSGLIIVEEYYQ